MERRSPAARAYDVMRFGGLGRWVGEGGGGDDKLSSVLRLLSFVLCRLVSFAVPRIVICSSS